MGSQGDRSIFFWDEWAGTWLTKPWPQGPECKVCHWPRMGATRSSAPVTEATPAWASLQSLQSPVQAVLGREGGFQTVPGRAPVFPHQHTECRHCCSGNHVLYLEPHSEGTFPLGHRKAANRVVWYKAMAKGLQEIPHRWGPRPLGRRLPWSL